MSLEFISFESPKDEYGNVKCTVHKSGRLGFSSGANKYMDLDLTKRLKVGFPRQDAFGFTEKGIMFLVPASEYDEEGFKIYKAGNYYYLKLKSVFEKNEIDYRSGGIIYDIERKSNNDIVYYELTLRKRVAKISNKKTEEL